HDARLRGGEGGGGCGGGGQGLGTGCLEGGGESVGAVVTAREGIIGGQDGLGIRTGEVDRASIADGLVAVGVPDRDRKGARGASRDGRGETAHAQSAGCRRIDCDARLRGGEGWRDYIGGSQGLSAGRSE